MMRKIGSLLLRRALTFVMFLFMALTGQKSLACDPNDELPGALPPAPNGGELGEAKKVDLRSEAAIEEGTAPEPKLYWEGVHLKEEKQIHLAIVKAVPPKTAVFTVLSPEREISDLQIKVELAREQKFIAVPFSVAKDRVIVHFDSKDVNRFIIHIEGHHADGLRRAMVQIEEE